MIRVRPCCPLFVYAFVSNNENSPMLSRVPLLALEDKDDDSKVGAATAVR